MYRRTTVNDVNQKVEDMEEVIPTQRINSHLVPEADTLACDQLGTCKLLLRDYNYR